MVYGYQVCFDPTSEKLVPISMRRGITANPGSNHICVNCGKSYKWKHHLSRHLKFECNRNPRFFCPFCPFGSKRRSNVYLHIKNRHKGQKIYAVEMEPES
ncbi:longitudinals lacking protein, isoforms A/B/D/L-like [Belonocnema kinseyi]|uniref:longitudinals lacking protein, isoforms A/B/D/L-like n=1 Tax=Belonocnema kinseyi TaxID=2817044 RepID=UPI00143D6EF3|nr:longitudinals lacking protein, isoforms A/B/D/L-like [Belonocnema kinseyi]